MTTDKTDHWQNVYDTKAPTEVSWFRPHLDVSLELIKRAGLQIDSRVIDIGAGASTLIDDLLDLGVRQVTAFDISATSLEVAKKRLGLRAAHVEWLVGDAARYRFEENRFDVWHDRAALHFLIDPADAIAYVDNATRAIRTGGFAIIGCFASDGPEKCSGLPVARREPEEIAKLFGARFTLVDQRHEQHITPWGASQSFAYALMVKNA